MRYTEVEKNCEICGSINTKHVRSKNIYGKDIKITDGDKIFNSTDVMCMDCGLIYKNPMMSQQSLNEFYTKEYMYIFSPGLASGIPKGELLVRTIDNIYLMEWLKNNNISIKGLDVLNVGSGLGVLSYFFEEYGAKVSSIEPLSRACEIAKKLFGTDAMQQNFEEYDTDDRYDLIVFQNSLEHFFSPKGALIKVKSLLRDKGRILVEIPDVFYPYPRITVDAWLSSAHNYSFSEDTIWKLFAVCGYKITHCEHKGDKAKMLIMATPGEMVFNETIIPEKIYDNLYDMFKEMEVMENNCKKYMKELLENKDVNDIVSTIKSEMKYNSNIPLLLLVESLNNNQQYEKSKRLLELLPYEDNVPYDINNNKGTLFLFNAMIARKMGDMLNCKKLLDMSIANYPPINQYNIVKNMMINSLISESTIARNHFWSAKKMLESIQ